VFGPEQDRSAFEPDRLERKKVRLELEHDLTEPKPDRLELEPDRLRRKHVLLESKPVLLERKHDRLEGKHDLLGFEPSRIESRKDRFEIKHVRLEPKPVLLRPELVLLGLEHVAAAYKTVRPELENDRLQLEQERSAFKKRQFVSRQDRSRHPQGDPPMVATLSVHRSVAVLKLPTVVAALITHAQSIVAAMTGNAAFPSPAPSLAILTAAIAALQVAQSAALARTKGAVTARNDKKAALVVALQQLHNYVQGIADADADNSAAIIQSAGIAVRKTPVRKPRVFSVLQGAVSGAVKVVTASAGTRASYDWEYSIDGGKTWTILPSTMQAKTSVAGLAPGSTVQVRFRALTRTGEGDWSQPASLLVK